MAGEKYCIQYNQLYGLKTVSFRYGIVFGPHEWYGRVATLFIKRALEGKPPIIFGDGNQRRDFVYVEDVVDAMCYFVDNYYGKQPLNIGTGVDHTIEETARIIADVVGYKGDIQWDTSKPDGMPQKLLDVKLAKQFGWEAKVSLRDGIERTYKAYNV